LFKVFEEYESNNILLRQSYRELMEQQMEEERLRAALKRIQQSKIICCYPTQLTPLSFPIIADGLNRNQLSTENSKTGLKNAGSIGSKLKLRK